MSTLFKGVHYSRGYINVDLNFKSERYLDFALFTRITEISTSLKRTKSIRSMESIKITNIVESTNSTFDMKHGIFKELT